MNEKQLSIKEAVDLGYSPARILPSGECAGLMRMMFTVGLFVGLGDFYRTRFCYQTWKQAKEALYSWDGRGDPPGNWIVEKGGGDRMNPNYKVQRREAGKEKP